MSEESGVYYIYVGGVYLFKSEYNSEAHAIQSVKEQIENLWPLNMSADNVEAYRDRFRNQPITIKKLY